MPDEILKTEHQYVLKQPFTYSHGGETAEAQFIELKAPSSRNSRECGFLKQAFFRASRSFEGEENPDANPDEIQGADVITMLAMGPDVQLADVLDVAKELFTKGKVAMVEGETPLTKPLLDLMSEEDLEAMTGEYLVNFTLASSLARMKEKSLKGSQT